MGVSENRGPYFSTLNSRIVIIRNTKNKVPLIFRSELGAYSTRVLHPGKPRAHNYLPQTLREDPLSLSFAARQCKEKRPLPGLVLVPVLFQGLVV